MQKNILRLSNEEIESITKGLTLDKRQDLEIEAVQIGGEEEGTAPTGGGPLGMGPSPTIDLGGPPPLSEENKLSIEDEMTPIKIQADLTKIGDMLNEENEEDSQEKEMTPFEEFQKEAQKDTKIKNRKARKNHLFADNFFSEYQRNRAQNDVSGMPREISNLKQSIKPPSDHFLEEDFDIGEYLDTKIEQNALMTGQLKSTLSKMDDVFGYENKSVISERKESTEDNSET